MPRESAAILVVTLALLAVLAACQTAQPVDPDTARREAYLEAHPETAADVAAAVRRGEVVVGMSLAQIVASRGWPDGAGPADVKFGLMLIEYNDGTVVHFINQQAVKIESESSLDIDPASASVLILVWNRTLCFPVRPDSMEGPWWRVLEPPSDARPLPVLRWPLGR